jgi:hypothetical protein
MYIRTYNKFVFLGEIYVIIILSDTVFQEYRKHHHPSQKDVKVICEVLSFPFSNSQRLEVHSLI